MNTHYSEKTGINIHFDEAETLLGIEALENMIKFLGTKGGTRKMVEALDQFLFAIKTDVPTA